MTHITLTAEDVTEAKRLLSIYSRASKFLEIVSGEQPVTTPDVCGEVCARAKLCYGCNKDLEEANAKYAEQAEQEPVAFVSDVYQSRYTLEWNGRSLPVGTPLYDHPLSLAVSQELEHMAEEAECVQLSLDKAGVPTADASGKVYSLLGRVCRYTEQAEQEPVARVDAWPHLDNDRIIVNLIPWDKLPIGTKLYAAPVSIQNESETDSSSSLMRTTVRTKDLTDDVV